MTAATAETWTTPQVVRLTGLTYRQVDYWARVGVLMPAVAATGSGTQRRYDAADLRILAVLAVLRTGGISLDVCRQVVQQLRDVPEDVWSLRQIVGTADWAIVTNNPGELLHARRLRLAWIVDLAAVLTDLRRAGEIG